MQEVKVLLDPGFTIGAISPKLFGSFLEHIGRAIYGGIYEPGHPRADGDGFRADVIELVRELGVTGVRYPGGNFVSGFRWEDSVGPRAERPRRRELAWHSTETNEIGLHEFHAWTQKAGLELLRRLRDRAPGLGLRVIDSGVPRAEMLRDGQCQIVISPRPPDAADLVQKRLFEDRYAVFYDAKPINVRDLPLLVNYPGSKYPKVAFAKPGQAHRLCAKLNDLFRTDKFTVVALTSGIVVKPGMY